MKKLCIMLLLTTSLSGCEIVNALRGGMSPEDTAAADAANNQAITREAIEASDVATIRAQRTGSNQPWTYYVAQSESHDAVSYGRQGRLAVTFRGHLVISQYILGNDLTGVTPNPQDPLQYPRPLASWPSTYNREYQLPGEGLSGDLRQVQCEITQINRGAVDIMGLSHDTILMSEHCEGSGLDFENRYMVDEAGMVWISEQWAGQNGDQLLIEVIEPFGE